MFEKIVDKLIERSLATPYYHLYHRDGSPYMYRYWTMPKAALRVIDGVQEVDSGLRPPTDAALGFELRDDIRHLPAARLHNICTADLDREMHNHPWSFISIVLRGGYTERRPLYENPEFDAFWGDEPGYIVRRKVGSIAFRSHNDRHRIVHVERDTWTLILMGPKRQTWGFFTAAGFVNWREFSSAHNTRPL